MEDRLTTLEGVRPSLVTKDRVPMERDEAVDPEVVASAAVTTIRRKIILVVAFREMSAVK